MDGGGRLLRSLRDFGAHATPQTAYAAVLDPFAFPVLPEAVSKQGRRAFRHRLFIRRSLARIAHSRFLGTMLALGFLGATGVYGLFSGGAYAEFIATQGTIPDILAKAAGFSIKAVTITGTRELTEGEILKLAGIGPRNSLVFLSVSDLRAKLRAVPLIKDASVSKLYPNRLLLEVEERQPTGLWQKDGAVAIVAADGTPIDDMHDPRFEHLPLVVGEGANLKLAEYIGILEAAGDLRDRVRAGMYVAGRRWTLKTDSGIEILLPEKNPANAISRLALLEHDGHLFEKDILSVDLRMPGRVVARLSPDAGATRAAALEKKTKKKGAST